MPRSQASDKMQGFRFHVYSVQGNVPLAFTDADAELEGAEAGFTSCTIPEISTDAVEYREGTLENTIKQPGIKTVSSCTLTRGVSRNDTKFYDWMMQAVGGGEYRTDLLILHFHRDEPRISGGSVARNAKRQYLLLNAFPVRAKVAGDLEATSGDISVAEIDLECEDIKVTTTGSFAS